MRSLSDPDTGGKTVKEAAVNKLWPGTGGIPDAGVGPGFFQTLDYLNFNLLHVSDLRTLSAPLRLWERTAFALIF